MCIRGRGQGMRCDFMPFVKLPHIFLIHPVDHDISLSKCIGSCLNSTIPVSYTHLDVYKRQALDPKTASKVLALTDKIIKENSLTAMMVTHNMRDAIAHGNRLIMICLLYTSLQLPLQLRTSLTESLISSLFS